MTTNHGVGSSNLPRCAIFLGPTARSRSLFEGCAFGVSPSKRGISICTITRSRSLLEGCAFEVDLSVIATLSKTQMLYGLSKASFGQLSEGVDVCETSKATELSQNAHAWAKLAPQQSQGWPPC